MLQAARDDPDVPSHHHDDTKYNHVFHVSPHFLVGSEEDSFVLGVKERVRQPGHGWPQRSQLEPDTGSRGGVVSLTASCNSRAESAGLSFNRRSVLIVHSSVINVVNCDWLLPFGVFQTAHYD